MKTFFEQTYSSNKAVLEIPKQEQGAVLTGPGVAYDFYRVAELHFHWGRNNSLGSEHSFNGRRYPLEVGRLFFFVQSKQPVFGYQRLIVTNRPQLKCLCASFGLACGTFCGCLWSFTEFESRSRMATCFWLTRKKCGLRKRYSYSLTITQLIDYF